MTSSYLIVSFLLIFFSDLSFSELDFSLECRKGYRVSAIKRVKTYYSALGSLSVECESISDPSSTFCDSLQSIPQCNGAIEGCSGSSWLAGFKAFLLENTTAATVLDPICCSSPNVRIDPNSCINDHLNTVKSPFCHSIVSDLVYRGLQCWHQYDANKTLVDLIWKTEICSFESDLSTAIDRSDCGECKCECGIRQCADGREPIRIVHKTRGEGCSCDCQCAYKCLDFTRI